jgi:DNA-directed RNA polymerase specialized sigma subunit
MISKESLKKLYLDENKTQSEAAAILGISQSQV